MKFRNAILAPGGSPCVWQLGLWEGGKEETFELGLDDGQALGRSCVLGREAYSSAQWRDPF
jgi:hypothetical protein